MHEPHGVPSLPPPQETEEPRYIGTTLKQGAYQAQIYVDGRMEYLGRWARPADAARAYDQ